MLYHYRVCDDSNASFPRVQFMPAVEAESPVEAVQKLVRGGCLPDSGQTIYVQVVTAVHDNGRPHKVLVVAVSPSGASV